MAGMVARQEQSSSLELALVRELDLAGYGGPEVFIGDVDGDGRLELVWLQDCGIFHIWRARLPEHWPQGRPRSFPREREMHMGRPLTVWRTGLAERPEVIVYNEAGWPYLVGGNGEPELLIPCPPHAVQPEVPLPAHRPDDYGYGFRTWPADLDGDGEEELLVHDRRYAWIFKRR